MQNALHEVWSGTMTALEASRAYSIPKPELEWRLRIEQSKRTCNWCNSLSSHLIKKLYDSTMKELCKPLLTHLTFVWEFVTSTC